MATINGTQSVFVSVPTPECQTPTSYQAYVAGAVRIAEEMALEQHRIDEAAWLADAEAQAEYQAWCEEVDSGFPTNVDLDRMAEEAELSRLGDAYLIGANTNHDAIWQAGGDV